MLLKLGNNEKNAHYINYTQWLCTPIPIVDGAQQCLSHQLSVQATNGLFTLKEIKSACSVQLVNYTIQGLS